jgi:single-stranded-DNA-specific exonuclease
VVNPQLRPDAPERPNISGAMVALKLASLLLSEEQYLRLFELACLGTVADVVPLIGDNRVVVKEGLRLINDEPSPAIQALKDVASVRRLSAGLMSFTLIPRLNASGRVDNAMQVVQLLLSEQYDEALSIAENLNRLNSERQRIEQDVLKQAFELVEEKGFDRCIVVGGQGWHEGVVGIVASRLVDAFYRPSFVLNIEKGIAKGSARGIPEFDLYRALCECQDLLISFGGHRQAAGLRLKAQDLDAFEERINAFIKETLTDEQLVPMLKIDASVKLRDVTNGLVKEIEALEPYGYGNPEPVLGAKAIQLCRARTVGNGHLKVLLKDQGLVIDAIGFDMGQTLDDLVEGGLYDVVFTPQINEWEGMRAIQLKLHGIRPAKTEETE